MSATEPDEEAFPGGRCHAAPLGRVQLVLYDVITEFAKRGHKTMAGWIKSVAEDAVADV